MSHRKKKDSSSVFLEKTSFFPILMGIAAGLYPLIFYYSRNFGMINSWEQFFYFVLLFLGFPILFFSLLQWGSRFFSSHKWGKYIIPFFSVFVFLLYIEIVLYTGIQKKILLGIFLISALCSILFHKHLKRWVFMQFVLAFIGLIGLVPILYKYVTYSDSWTKQPDNIEQVVFQKRPNVYFIQPDGYVSLSELSKGFYQVDNSKIESFLTDNGFTNYPDFRSNYITTLTSNSAIFTMKHHHYLNSTDYSEMLHARENIVSNNAVLSIFKNNGYKTHFFSEHPYLMVNRPKMGYDYSNIEYSEIPYITTGFEVKKDVYSDLENVISHKAADGNFFFIQTFEPGHVSTTQSASQGKDEEKKMWMEKLEIANTKIENLVSLILKNDPDALIMIMADHGGFVGLDYTRQIYTKTIDRDVIYSAFGTILSVRWGNEAEQLRPYLKSGVNVFRVLFSYLGNENKYLESLQPDRSYLILNEGEKPGIYEYIDDEGNIVCNRFSESD